MKIKVYNENGNIKITKVTDNDVELTMFSELSDGEVAEITIESYISLCCRKNIISQ